MQRRHDSCLDSDCPDDDCTDDVLDNLLHTYINIVIRSTMALQIA